MGQPRPPPARRRRNARRSGSSAAARPRSRARPTRPTARRCRSPSRRSACLPTTACRHAEHVAAEPARQVEGVARLQPGRRRQRRDHHPRRLAPRLQLHPQPGVRRLAARAGRDRLVHDGLVRQVRQAAWRPPTSACSPNAGAKTRSRPKSTRTTTATRSRSTTTRAWTSICTRAPGGTARTCATAAQGWSRHRATATPAPTATCRSTLAPTADPGRARGGDHGGGDAATSSSPDDVRRHRVDQVAKRPQPHAVLDRRAGGRGDVHVALELHHADRAEHAHVATPGELARGLQPGAQPPLDRAARARASRRRRAAPATPARPRTRAGWP